MKYEAMLRLEAENDVKEAFLWYEDERKGLGYDFLLQLDAGIKAIERNPRVCHVEYKGTRKFLIRRFPYKIIYLVDREKVIVLAVIHGKRSPNLIKKRINNL